MMMGQTRIMAVNYGYHGVAKTSLRCLKPLAYILHAN